MQPSAHCTLVVWHVTVGVRISFQKWRFDGRCVATALRLHGFSVQRTMNWKLKCCYLEVATEPLMDLPISRLIRPYCLAWRGSNKAVTLSLNWHWSGSLTDRYQVCRANGWEGSPLDLVPYLFVRECLHVSISGTSFSSLFSKLFRWVWALVLACQLSVSFRLG